MLSFNAIVVDSAIFMLKALLQTLDVFLGIVEEIRAHLFPRSAPQSGETLQTVVIVGGNFAGLAALWKLLAAGNFQIVLIDQRNYSEYTPGILRLFCEPRLFADLAQPLPSSRRNFTCLQGKVTSLDKDKKILTYVQGSSSKTLAYDYVILATGSTYTAPISPLQQEMTLKGRQQGWNKAHDRLRKATKIIVLGGGAVGVELAAEIVDHYDKAKQVTLLDAQSSLVPNFPPSVGAYAQKWLESRGVQVRLGQLLSKWTETSCTLQDGTVLEADIVYVCFGSRPNSEMVVSTKSCSLTQRKNIQVQDTLQVADDKGSRDMSSCIFACGDLASPPSSGEDQAFQAETQGKLAAKNVLTMISSSDSKKLCRYPRDVAGIPEMPLLFVLSLGQHDGVLGFNWLTIPGPLAAIAKFVLEYTKVLDMRGSLLGSLVWKVADAVVLVIARMLLRSESRNVSTHIKAA